MPFATLAFPPLAFPNFVITHLLDLSAGLGAKKGFRPKNTQEMKIYKRYIKTFNSLYIGPVLNLRGPEIFSNQVLRWFLQIPTTIPKDQTIPNKQYQKTYLVPCLVETIVMKSRIPIGNLWIKKINMD